LIRCVQDPLVYYQFESLAAFPNLVHAVSTRHGAGPRPGPPGLNLAYHVGDDPDTVEANRSLFLRSVAPDGWSVASVRQVHGDGLRVVGSADASQLQARHWDRLPEADAMVCTDPNVLLMAYSADCPLVLLWDPSTRTIGLVHAGWRPAVARLVEKTARYMVAQTGCVPGQLHAGIGPGIGACCFEVGQDVLDRAREAFCQADALFHCRNGRTTFDLAEAIRIQLLAVGVHPSKIDSAGLCTACRTDEFFSYRAEGPRTGRFAAVIGRRPGDGEDAPCCR